MRVKRSFFFFKIKNINESKKIIFFFFIFFKIKNIRDLSLIGRISVLQIEEISSNLIGSTKFFILRK